MTAHRCTREDCGRECHPDYDGTPLTSIHVPDGDTGGYDADDQPCPCYEHLTPDCAADPSHQHHSHDEDDGA